MTDAYGMAFIALSHLVLSLAHSLIWPLTRVCALLKVHVGLQHDSLLFDIFYLFNFDHVGDLSLTHDNCSNFS